MSDPCISPELVARAEAAMQALKAKGLSVVTAESCTAGLVAAALAQADGASEQLHGSFVVYTKANKTKSLHVSASVLARYGSVTSEVAELMAKGALERSPADIAVAVTGVLGPDEDEDRNPVGLVFLSCCRRWDAPRTVRRDYGKHHHERLRRLTVCDALGLLERTAKERE